MGWLWGEEGKGRGQDHKSWKVGAGSQELESRDRIARDARSEGEGKRASRRGLFAKSREKIINSGSFLLYLTSLLPIIRESKE